jgi:type II secretory pathway component GspD/PulD (secretin)
MDSARPQRFRWLTRWAAQWMALSGCLIAALAWAQSLEVIPLKHRSAQEVIPIVQPLLDPGAAISGQDYTLFVRTSPANLAQLRAAIEQLDRAPRQLRVSVRQGSSGDEHASAASASGTLRTDNGSVSVNEPARGASGVTVRATDATNHVNDGSVASVQVSEGMSAYVSTGTSVPIVTVVAGAGLHRPWVAAGTEYRDVTTGFMVTPRVNGDVVILDINQQDERVAGGAIQSQRIGTQVTGRLGQWIELGGVSESAARSSSGALNRQYSTRSDSRSVWIKVETR